MLTGTIVNVLAILAGSMAGLLLTWLARHFSHFLPSNSVALGERLQTIIMQGVALCILFLGISGSLKGQADAPSGRLGAEKNGASGEG